jgi:hypothetical protein
VCLDSIKLRDPELTLPHLPAVPPPTPRATLAPVNFPLPDGVKRGRAESFPEAREAPTTVNASYVYFVSSDLSPADFMTILISLFAFKGVQLL